MTFGDWWRTRLVPPTPTRAQLRRAAREAWDAATAERARCAAVVARLRDEFVTAEARYAADQIAAAVRGGGG
jgi:hypothetical protein